ncbi:hypothetical protein [Shewanella sp. ECSMB14102]|uniref:hypothetical protein n=1 Tax=Shewanella sp. ECSMB14102 TaxID=1579504 RepID=UPI00057A6A1A|nr:hypothetical protein [Shewanella sp. ECSMB14102]
MSKVEYLSGWQPELCIQLDIHSIQKADFNRFLVKHFPSTQSLQQGGHFEDADREGAILQLKKSFDKAIEEGGSHHSLYQVFSTASLYLRWCDKQSVNAFTQCSVEGYMSHHNDRVMLGLMKSSTYARIRGEMSILVIKYLDLPYHYFDNVVVRGSSDTEPYEAYTRSDLNQLLPFLRQIFKQTHKQLITCPEKHFDAYKNVPTMTFHWQGQQYLFCGGVSKMMCAGTFLLAYYTHSNTGNLLQLRHPDNASTTLGEVWYTMPAFKRRAFKTIQVEMCGHELDIPKYALDFFDKLREVSMLIDTGEHATLLQTVVANKVQPIKPSTLRAFADWMEKHFLFIDQTGRRLRPVISRFRETGAQLTAFHQGDMANDIMLNNTPNTRKKHYSEGNKTTNNGMLQDAMAIREEQVKRRVTTPQARQNLAIDVLVIEQENSIKLPNLSRTSSGSSCSNPFGEKSEKYTKQARRHGLAKEGERLACADLLACFGCPEQVIVQSVADIWCLLSFKACIEESLCLHLDAVHYRNNFEAIISFIDQKILPNLHAKVLKQAETRLDDDGLHPAWGEADSILNLIPRADMEVK